MNKRHFFQYGKLMLIALGIFSMGLIVYSLAPDHHTASHHHSHSRDESRGTALTGLNTTDAQVNSTTSRSSHSSVSVETAAAQGLREAGRKDMDSELGTQDTVETNQSGDPVSSLLALVHRIVESENPYNLSDSSKEFISMLQASPESLDAFIQAFAVQPDGIAQDVMLNLLLETAMVLGEDEIEKAVVAMISSGNYDHENGIYQLGRELGVRDPQSRATLLAKLPSLSESEQVGAVIDSIVPQIVSAEERQTVVADISPYLGASDDQVRSAAVRALGSWGGAEQAPVIDGALSDQSGDVRHAGAVAALRSNVRSDNIKHSLLSLMKDENEELDIRQQAFYALSNYNLTGSQYDDYYQFNEEIERLSGHHH